MCQVDSNSHIFELALIQAVATDRTERQTKVRPQPQPRHCQLNAQFPSGILAAIAALGEFLRRMPTDIRMTVHGGTTNHIKHAYEYERLPLPVASAYHLVFYFIARNWDIVCARASVQ